MASEEVDGRLSLGHTGRQAASSLGSSHRRGMKLRWRLTTDGTTWGLECGWFPYARKSRPCSVASEGLFITLADGV